MNFVKQMMQIAFSVIGNGESAVWVLPIYIWFSVFRNSVCAFRNSVRRVWSGFQAVFMLENGVIDLRCGESVV